MGGSEASTLEVEDEDPNDSKGICNNDMIQLRVGQNPFDRNDNILCPLPYHLMPYVSIINQ